MNVKSIWNWMLFGGIKGIILAIVLLMLSMFSIEMLSGINLEQVLGIEALGIGVAGVGIIILAGIVGLIYGMLASVFDKFIGPAFASMGDLVSITVSFVVVDIILMVFGMILGATGDFVLLTFVGSVILTLISVWLTMTAYGLLGMKKAIPS